MYLLSVAYVKFFLFNDDYTQLSSRTAIFWLTWKYMYLVSVDGVNDIDLIVDFTGDTVNSATSRYYS